MESTRLALLLTGLFLVGVFAPAAEALGLSDVAPSIDLTTRATPPQPAVPTDAPKVYSPYGMDPAQRVVATSRPTSGFEPAALSIDTPLDQFLLEVVNEPRLTPQNLAGHMADYFAAMGFDTPGSSIAFEENATLTFSHEAGDLDQDGTTDLYFDQYCNLPDACIPILGGIIQNPRGPIEQPCTWPHSILAVSGKDGSPIWNLTRVDFNTIFGPYFGCANEFVVGTIPHEGHHDLLVYRYVTNYLATSIGNSFESQVTIQHRIALIDGLTARPVWTKAFEGYMTGEDFVYAFFNTGFVTGSNVLVNPILQTLPTHGVETLPANTATGLALQGVGFNVTSANTLLAPPYGTAAYTVINSYQPDEWAMGVDPATGRQLWRRDTFQPNERVMARDLPDRNAGPKVPLGNVSVRPALLQVPALPDTSCFADPTKGCRNNDGQFTPNTAPSRASNWFWGHTPCCYDLTGDGVPDLLYTVRETYAFPMHNTEGPHGTLGRIVAIDGQSGASLYNHVVEPGTGDRYSLFVESMGDVTKDGIADYFLHERHLTWDYHHDLTLMDGKTGTAVWAITAPRELQVLPLGDADKDGALDFVYLEYTLDISKVFAFGSFDRGTKYTVGNVSFTPIKVRSGATGDILWQYESFEAPNDIFAVFQSFRLNGLPDFDGDGVGDLIMDDPLFLPDLTKLHRFTYLSGADGTILFKAVTAGAFAFPALVGDVTGDGRDDFLLINGDVIDLWSTLYSGNGTAIWSRRVLTPRISSYESADPFIRVHPLMVANGTENNDVLLNFQLRITRVFRTVFFGVTLNTMTSVMPQIVRYTAWNGSADWAIPALWDSNMTVVVEGMSPASQLYATAHLFDARADRVPPAPFATPIQLTAGVTTFGAAFALSFFLGLRRWKP